MNDSGIANPDLIYAKGDKVASFFNEEFAVEVLLYNGRKAKAANKASRAKSGYNAKKSATNKASRAEPGYAAKASAYQIAYWAKNKGTLTAKVLAKRMSEAATRLNSGDSSESGTTILAQITTYLENLPDDRLAYIFMSRADQKSKHRETKTKNKNRKNGGRRKYVPREGVVMCDPREKARGSKASATMPGT